MVSPVERARLDFIKRTAKKKRRLAGMSVDEAIAFTKRESDKALGAASKGGVQINLTDLFVSRELLAEKRAKERRPARVVSVDELMRMPLSKIKALKAAGVLRGV